MDNDHLPPGLLSDIPPERSTPRASDDTIARPYRIGFVLIDGYALLSFAAAMEPLRAANRIAGKTLFLWQNLPVEGARSESSSGVSVRADHFIGETSDFDLVLIVAGGTADEQLMPRLIAWLQWLDRRGVVIGGISGGPLLLARAGLMSGEAVTVHREHVNLMATLAPDVACRQSRYLISERRMSAAGAGGAFDMMLSLVAQRHGGNLAVRISDWFVMANPMLAADPGTHPERQRHRDKPEALARALAAMETHIADPLTLGQLARIAGVGERQLNRLFRTHLQQSCLRHYRDLRIDAATELLTRGSLPLADIARATGFASPAHFSSSFRKARGCSPRACRNAARRGTPDSSASA
ncbi:MAG: AraC family transcriptional regulator [Gammaproteobacteria bacterium]|nr:MAG: AraC family transcriptional regulator [Gammaproteobacteria bacterium]